MSLESVVETFVTRPRQRRYLELLTTARGRARMRLELAHFRDFDPRFVVKIPSDKHGASSLERLLLDLGATGRCAVFSGREDLEGSDLPLRAAVAAVVGNGAGAVLSCGPGLAFYESEEAGGRFIVRTL